MWSATYHNFKPHLSQLFNNCKLLKFPHQFYNVKTLPAIWNTMFAYEHGSYARQFHLQFRHYVLYFFYFFTIFYSFIFIDNFNPGFCLLILALMTYTFYERLFSNSACSSLKFNLEFLDSFLTMCFNYFFGK